MAGESEESRHWRGRIYGDPAHAEDTYFVRRPAFVTGSEQNAIGQKRLRRRFGVDVDKIELDLPQPGPEVVFLSEFPKQEATAPAFPQLPTNIPESEKQRAQMEALLSQNALQLLKLKLFKTWYTDAELKSSPEYAATVAQIEQNFCSLLS